MEVKSSISRLIFKGEGVLRVLCMVLLVTTVCLARFDRETEVIFGSIKRTATVKDLDSLGVLVIVESVAAAYNFLQLSRWLLIIFHVQGGSSSSSSSPTFFNAKLAWFCFFLDQSAAYVSFGAVVAAGQASLLAITGASSLQWLKVCNMYTSFCFQIGGSLGCGFVASILMNVLACISAFNLFRHYSSKEFLVLKPSKSHVTSTKIVAGDRAIGQQLPLN